MTNEFKTIWSHSRIYGLGTIINRAAGLLLLPLYVNALAPEEYGLYIVVVSIIEVFGPLLGMGLGVAMIRALVDSDSDQQDSLITGTAFISFAVVACLFLAFNEPLGDIASMVMFGHLQHSELFALALFAVVFSGLFELELQYIRARKLSWLYLWMSLVKFFLFLGMNIWFVLVAGLGAEGIVLGTLVSSLAVSCIGLFIVFRRQRPGFSGAVLRKLIRVGLPMVPASMIDSVATAMDKYFLNHYAATASVGQYGFGERIVNALRMFIATPFAQIFVVRRLESLSASEDNNDKEFARVFLFFMALICFAVLGMSLFAAEIVALLAPEDYAQTAILIPIFGIAQIFIAMRLNFEIGIMHAQRTELMMMVSILSLIIAIPVYLLLVRAWGAIGAATGLLVINFTRTLLAAWMSNRVSHLARCFEWMAVARLLAAVTVLFGLSWFAFGYDISLMGIFTKSVLLSLFAFVTLSSLIGRDGMNELAGKLRTRFRNELP